jgi:hypothetical protein
MSPPFDTLHRDHAWLCSLPPSEGRPGIDATVLLCRDDCQLGLSQLELGLDLTALDSVACVLQLGPQFLNLDLEFVGHLRLLYVCER